MANTLGLVAEATTSVDLLKQIKAEHATFNAQLAEMLEVYRQVNKTMAKQKDPAKS